jgi:hypothetical protein
MSAIDTSPRLVTEEQLVELLAAFEAASDLLSWEAAERGDVSLQSYLEEIDGVRELLFRDVFGSDAEPTADDPDPWGTNPYRVAVCARATELSAEILDGTVERMSAWSNRRLIERAAIARAMAPRYRERGSVDIPWQLESVAS